MQENSRELVRRNGIARVSSPVWPHLNAMRCRRRRKRRVAQMYIGVTVALGGIYSL